MGIRIRLILLTSAALLFAGCASSGEAAPTPAPSSTQEAAAEPRTLQELASVMKGEGLADLVILAVVPGQTHEVAVQLAWKELPAPDAQLAALAEAEMRIGEVLDGGQIAQISLIPVPGGGQVKGVAAAYNPGPEVLAALVRTTYESVCQGADLAEVDTVEGPRTRVDLHCYVDTDDVVGIAAAYDEVTATRLDFAEIDETRWHVSVAGWSTTDANFRLVSGPLAGRQELFTELTTMARDAGASGIQVVDSMYGISFSGIVSADQSGLCGALLDRILAAGVASATVSMGLPEPSGDERWACYLRP